MTDIAIEVAHYASLAPLLLILWRPRRDLSYWLVALAFATSHIADTVAEWSGGSWSVTRFYVPVQLALFALAFTRRRDLVGAVFLAVAVMSFAGTGPDMIVRGVGSLVVLWLAKDHALSWSIFAYLGVGTVLYLGMVAQIDDVPVFMRWWYPYQGARLAAVALFIRAAMVAPSPAVAPVRN